MERPLAYLLVACATAGLLATSGCHQMYAQPYGGAAYGPTYPQAVPYQQAPIQTLTPGQQPYVPGGMMPSTSPQGATPTYQGGLQPIPDSGNNAPTYTPGTNPMTPNPYGPGAYVLPQGQGQPFSGIQQTGLTQPMPLGPPANGLRAIGPQTLPSAAYTPVPAARTIQGNIASPAMSSGDAFSAPMIGPPPSAPVSPLAPVGTASSLPSAEPAGAVPAWDLQANKVSSSGNMSFGNDTKFTWLRGIVSREPQDGVWSIVYNDNPTSEDRWAGHLSLSPNPQLEGLRDGEFVEIRGEVDAVIRDRSGKPVYAVSHVHRQTVAKQ